MDHCRRPSRRGSITPSGGQQQPCRSASVGAAPKRNSWSFNPVRSRDASLSTKHERHSSASPPTNDFTNLFAEELKVSSAPQSRATSPQPQLQPRPHTSRGPPSRVPNFSKTLPTRTRTLPTIMEQRNNAASLDSLRSRIVGSKVKRWDGQTRTTSPWNGIRRDSELFFERGNCVVHLYAKGQSKRGPSFRIPLDAIYSAKFDALFRIFYTEIASGGSGASRANGGSPKQFRPTLCEVYIPAPDESTRLESFNWHITTRNFFAYLLGKPLVGSNLGKAIVDLQERLHLLRPGNANNRTDLMGYLERIGYLEFAHCPDFSLALLYFAEYYQLQDLWIDAFVHCVGMNEMLSLSSEFEQVSRVTKALITRAYLEMDLHLGRVTRALSNFLEDDLSPAYLGLSSGARAHLERFRSFLNSYYVEKFGYWPPPKGSLFSKALYKSMYFDFRSLYDFLVDLDSTDSLQNQKPASGGICVLQNVQAFDNRHKYIPLPHPNPLLPMSSSATQRTQSQRALRTLKLGTKQAKTEDYFTARDALATATNSTDLAVTYAPLVKAYKRFERECTRRQEEKVSLSDARKVRWLLIYGTLQMLVSVIRAPKEVRDVDGPTYPLCCLVAGTPPWLAGAKALNTPHTPSINFNIPASAEGLEVVPSSIKPLPVAPPMSIQPDCGVEDYLSGHPHRSTLPVSRTSSVDIENPASTRVSGIFRNSSFRSVRALSFSSFGTRRNSQVVKAPTPNFCEILVHGYGNGLNQTILEPSSRIPSELSAEVLPEMVVSPQPSQTHPPRTSSFGGKSSALKRRTAPGRLVTPSELAANEPSRSPTLEGIDVHKMHDPVPGLEELDSPSDSSNSNSSAPLTPVWSRSASPSSASVHYNSTRVNRRSSLGANSTFSTNSTLLASPIEPPKEKESGITIKRTFSIERFVPNEMDLNDALNMIHPSSLPKAVYDEPVEVYQPSGLPLRRQSGSSSLRQGPKGSLKSNLKRSDATNKGRRRSVRIRDEVDLFEALRLAPVDRYISV